RLFFVDKETRLPEGTVPVGYPVHGQDVLILGDAEPGSGAREPAGFDVEGEIAVRSRHLALGYWRRPELTDESFREVGGDGERLYYTGDLGILRADGLLEHRGRRDLQVKIRGFRIETAEIQMALAALPDVKESVVVAREDERGERYLAAYVVPADGVVPGTGELREALMRTLPSYMVPAAFVALEALPLTPGGKVNLSRLPAATGLFGSGERGGFGAGVAPEFVAPRDEIEHRLVGLWERVLGAGSRGSESTRVRPVGVTDNFFERGGHSLSVARLLVEIEREFGRQIAPPAFYQGPTVEQVAELLRQGEAAGEAAWSPMVTLQAGGGRPPLFVLPGILGNVFTDLGHLARSLGRQQPVYAFQDGPRNPIWIEEHAALYVREIRRVQPEGPYLLAGVCYGAVLAFEMAQQIAAAGKPADVALLAMIEPARPWIPSLRTTLSYGPFLWDRFVRRLFRAVGTQEGAEEPVRVPRGAAEIGEFARLKLKLAANAWALRRYAPRPYAGAVDLFFSEGSLQVPDNPQREWYDLIEGSVRTHQIPGTHESITGDNRVVIEPEHMEVLAAQLEARIDEIVTGDRGLSLRPPSPGRGGSMGGVTLEEELEQPEGGRNGLDGTSVAGRGLKGLGREGPGSVARGGGGVSLLPAGSKKDQKGDA
ncbi:MAG TPA: thioesterase domain-containing protein, partial [Anaerolineae bacterium]|nr:thioesterase domain-containing protein [Anaerolineae bacterium]